MNSYGFQRLLPVVIIFILLWGYKTIICGIASYSIHADLICNLNWKDGFILTCCYSFTRLIASKIGISTIGTRLITTFVLYNIIYSILAFPYLLSSYFQPLVRNSFIHIFFLLTFLEIYFYSINNVNKRN